MSDGHKYPGSEISPAQCGLEIPNKKRPIETGLKSTPAGIRTPNLLIRSQMLYPIELRVHVLNEQL